MAVEQLESVKEAWIAERVAEFSTDPKVRDRAIAMILWDSLQLNQMMGELTTKVREGGVGGLIKGLMSGKS